MSLIQNAAFELALKVVTPVLVGMLVPLVVDALKRVNGWLDTAPGYVKQGVAVAVAALATSLSTLLGAPLPADLAAWDTAVVQTLCAAALGVAIKQGKQLKRKG